jgi:hypothetical protein
MGAQRQVVDGLWIGSSSPHWDDDDKKLLSKVVSAVQLLATHDRRRFNRIRRDLKRVLVYWIPGSWGRYFAPLDMCLLDAAFVADSATTHELLAATIVHEATHARLTKCGIGYDPSIQPRVERLCLQAELDFAAKLPNAQGVREVAEASLAAPDSYWSSTERAQGYRQAYMEAVDRLPIPRWLRRLLKRRVARKLGKPNR